MAAKWLIWCLLVFFLATVSVHSKFARGKNRDRSKSSIRGSARGSGSGCGERLPWEGRQETYDWAFQEVQPSCIDYSAPLYYLEMPSKAAYALNV